jgi:glutamyl-tRNA synthetase
LGWSFEDKEIFTLDESIKHFNISGIGKSPSKLDMTRILSMNEHYIKNINENDLFDQLKTYCEIYKKKIDIKKEETVKKSLNFLKNKAKTLEDIYNNAKYLISDELKINDEDLKLIDDKAKKIINEFSKNINESSKFTKEKFEEILNQLIKKHQTNFKGVGQPMRIALIGSKFGPGIFDIILSLGKETVIKRLSKFN